MKLKAEDAYILTKFKGREVIPDKEAVIEIEALIKKSISIGKTIARFDLGERYIQPSVVRKIQALGYTMYLEEKRNRYIIDWEIKT